MVTVAAATARVALFGAPSCTVKVSVGSSTASTTSGTVAWADVAPAGMVSTAVTAVKSSPATAVPATVR